MAADDNALGGLHTAFAEYLKEVVKDPERMSASWGNVIRGFLKDNGISSAGAEVEDLSREFTRAAPPRVDPDLDFDGEFLQ